MEADAEMRFWHRSGYEKGSSALIKSYRAGSVTRDKGFDGNSQTQGNVLPDALLYLVDNLRSAPPSIR